MRYEKKYIYKYVRITKCNILDDIYLIKYINKYYIY